VTLSAVIDRRREVAVSSRTRRGCSFATSAGMSSSPNPNPSTLHARQLETVTGGQQDAADDRQLTSDIQGLGDFLKKLPRDGIASGIRRR
jgi:hypothetical protein